MSHVTLLHNGEMYIMCHSHVRLDAFTLRFKSGLKNIFDLTHSRYGVACIRRLLKIIGLFCRISSLV